MIGASGPETAGLPKNKLLRLEFLRSILGVPRLEPQITVLKPLPLGDECGKCGAYVPTTEELEHEAECHDCDRVAG